MVTEKIAESMAAATTLMSGGSGHAVVAKVRRRVRSNSRRLSRYLTHHDAYASNE